MLGRALKRLLKMLMAKGKLETTSARCLMSVITLLPGTQSGGNAFSAYTCVPAGALGSDGQVWLRGARRNSSDRSGLGQGRGSLCFREGSGCVCKALAPSGAGWGLPRRRLALAHPGSSAVLGLAPGCPRLENRSFLGKFLFVLCASGSWFQQLLWPQRPPAPLGCS